MRSGPFYPDHGLERIVDYHERQDARFAAGRRRRVGPLRQAGAHRHRAGRHPPRQRRSGRGPRQRAALLPDREPGRHRARPPLAPRPPPGGPRPRRDAHPAAGSSPLLRGAAVAGAVVAGASEAAVARRAASDGASAARAGDAGAVGAARPDRRGRAHRRAPAASPTSTSLAARSRRHRASRWRARTSRYAHRADEPLVPASTQKLLTATAALEVLDPSAAFRTIAVAATGARRRGGRGRPHPGRGRRPAARHGRLRRLASGASRSSSPTSTALAAAIVDARCARASTEPSSATSAATTTSATWPAGRSATSTSGSAGPLSALAVNDGFAAYPTAGDRTTELAPPPDPAVDAAAVLTATARGTRRRRGRRAPRRRRPRRRRRGRRRSSRRRSSTSSRQLLQESDNNTAELLLKELGARPATRRPPAGAAVVADVAAASGRPHGRRRLRARPSTTA